MESEETGKGDHLPSTASAEHTAPKASKRRKHSEGNHTKAHGHKHGPPASKRAKLHRLDSISSTQVANNVMKFRLGGSVSDPLNLEGNVNKTTDGECSTCAPSPAIPSGQPSPLPQYLQRDPLNLEGKVKKFPLHKQTSGGAGGSHACSKPGHKKRARHRRRSNSKSEDQESNGGRDKKTAEQKDHRKAPGTSSKFRYGNYDRYYGYRNSGVREDDLRISLLRRDWFAGKDCLDIGCNTGQVTIRIARDFKPRKIVGIDIDSKLVRMAWKNLHREHVPTVAPDGRPFPQSLLMSRGPPAFPPFKATPTEVRGQEESEMDVVGGEPSEDKGDQVESRGFPHNIEFNHCNYVPREDSFADSQKPEYDTILALSLSKWIHLNWGDSGIKRFFRRVFNHLRPGGRLVFEPQPFASYSKKKKLTPEIFKNFQSISFFPRDFHSYLMSPEVGFTKHRLLGVPENESKGFRRPLHLYIKAATPTKQATPTSSTGDIRTGSGNQEECDRSPVAHGRRLKSVVVDVSKSVTLATNREHSVEDSVSNSEETKIDKSTRENLSVCDQRADRKLHIQACDSGIGHVQACDSGLGLGSEDTSMQDASN